MEQEKVIDSLVEWLNEQLLETAESFDFRSNQAFAQVLDKIKELRP